MKYINKKLSIDKVNFLKIAKKYGTPTYCFLLEVKRKYFKF